MRHTCPMHRLLGDTMMHFAPDARATTRLLSKLAKESMA